MSDQEHIPPQESSSEIPGHTTATSTAAQYAAGPAPASSLPSASTASQLPTASPALTFRLAHDTSASTLNGLSVADQAMPRAMTRSLSSTVIPSRRFQPYLAQINTDQSSWHDQAAVPFAAASSFDSPTSSGSTNSYMNPNYGSNQLPYYTAVSAGYASAYFPSDYASAQPRALASGSYGATPLAPSFTSVASGGGGPLPSPDSIYANQPLSARRHTITGATAAASPGSDGATTVHADSIEGIVKEEKRRRNKESSQRFRDRTRERQREKQERLEYLERRVKDLEEQLRDAKSAAHDAGPPAAEERQPIGGATVSRLLMGENESALNALTRLQRENDGLRAALKTAEQEIIRTRSTSAPASTVKASASAGALRQSPADSSHMSSNPPSPAADLAFADASMFFGQSHMSSAHQPQQGVHVDFSFSDACASPSELRGQHPSSAPLGQQNFSAPPSASADRMAWEPRAASAGPSGEPTLWPADPTMTRRQGDDA